MISSQKPASARPALSWNRSDPCQPAVRADGRREPSRAFHALLDYLHLGPGRTITGLADRYRASDSPPTRSIATLRMWSSRYEWPSRASRFDAIEDLRAQSEYRACREAILKSGLALDHERIERLTALYEKLSALALTDEAFWVNDVKTLDLGNGQVERIVLRRFNGDLVRVLRGLLDDLASETGGRSRRFHQEQPDTNAAGWENYSLDMLTPEERSELFRLSDKIFLSPIQEDSSSKNND